MWDTWARSLGWEDHLEKGMDTHSVFWPGIHLQIREVWLQVGMRMQSLWKLHLVFIINIFVETYELSQPSYSDLGNFFFLIGG